MNKVLMPIGLALVVLVINGCATVGESNPTPIVPDKMATEPSKLLAHPMQDEASETEVASASFPPELLFRLMTAEIAAQQGDVELAANEYADAAFATRDVKVVEQAIRYAAMSGSFEIEKASELATLWVELAPDITKSHQALAMVQLQRGDTAVAIDQLNYLLTNFDVFNFDVVIKLLSRQHNKEGALNVIGALAQAHPDDAEAHFAHAHLAARFGNPELALEANNRAIKLRPAWRNPIILQSRLLQVLEREGEAIDLLKERLSGEMGDDIEMRKILARLLLRNKEIELAWSHYKMILEQQPSDDESRYLYAVSSLDLGKKELGLEQLTQLSEQSRHQDDARFQLGRMGEIDKQPDVALEWYRSVNGGQYLLPARLREASLLSYKQDYDSALAVMASLEAEDANQKLNITLVTGDILFRAKRYQQAMTLYSEQLEQLPNSIPLLYSRAMISDRVGDVVLMEQDLRAILGLDSDNVDALNALGYNLANRGVQLEEALGYLERAMALKPGSGAITDSVGWLYFRMGKYEQARDYLLQALQIMYDVEIAAHLGEVLWVLGEHDRARHVWQKALERDPNHPVLSEVVERLDR